MMLLGVIYNSTQQLDIFRNIENIEHIFSGSDIYYSVKGNKNKGDGLYDI